MNAEEAAKQIAAILAQLSDTEREETMNAVKEKYCSECWKEQPSDGYCHCWNDE